MYLSARAWLRRWSRRGDSPNIYLYIYIYIYICIYMYTSIYVYIRQYTHMRDVPGCSRMGAPMEQASRLAQYK